MQAPVSMGKRIPVRVSSTNKALVETEATTEGGDLTIHFLTRHTVSHISWQQSKMGVIVTQLGSKVSPPEGVTRSYKEKANSNRPIGPYKAVRYLT